MFQAEAVRRNSGFVSPILNGPNLVSRSTTQFVPTAVRVKIPGSGHSDCLQVFCR